MVTELRAVIRGNVQGVGYRDFVSEAAAREGVTGFVRNRADGSVEVLGQGYPEALQHFAIALQEGPILASSIEAAIDMRTMSVAYDDFKVLP